MGEGTRFRSPQFELKTFFPTLQAWYPLLSGPSFYFTYAISGVVWGILAQRMNRTRLLVVASGLWSAASIVSGWSVTLPMFAAMRVLSGMSQAAAMPLMYSLVNDFFPLRIRGTANSTLMAASWAGIGAAGLSIIAITALGWRNTYIAYGMISLAFGALAMLFVKEPKRALTSAEPDSVKQALVEGKDPTATDLPPANQ